MSRASRVEVVLVSLLFIVLMLWLSHTPGPAADDAVSADDATVGTGALSASPGRSSSTVDRSSSLPLPTPTPWSGWPAAASGGVPEPNESSLAGSANQPAIPNGAVQAPYGNAPITNADWADDPNPVTWNGQPVYGAARDPLGMNQPSDPMDPAWQRPSDLMDPRQNEPMPHACDHDPYCLPRR